MSGATRGRQPTLVRFGDIVQLVSAVIFDKDGVLFDHLSLLARLHALRRAGIQARYDDALARAYDRSVGIDPDASQVSNVSGDGSDAYAGAYGMDVDGPLAMAVIEDETIVLAALLYRETRRPWLECLATAHTIFAEADRQLDLSAISPLPGFPTALTRLKAAGVVVAIVTGDQRERSELQLKPYALGQTVDLLLAGDDTPYHKPDPRTLLHALAQFGIPPHEAVMVGDTANDWNMARLAGIPAVAVRPGRRRVADTLTSIAFIDEIAPSSDR